MEKGVGVTPTPAAELGAGGAPEGIGVGGGGPDGIQGRPTGPGGWITPMPRSPPQAPVSAGRAPHVRMPATRAARRPQATWAGVAGQVRLRFAALRRQRLAEDVGLVGSTAELLRRVVRRT